MMYLFFSFVLALVYWIASMTTGDYKFPLGLFKWLAAVLTHSHPFAPLSIIAANPTLLFSVKITRLQTLFRWITITSYSVGDIVLLWDEPSSLPFFGVGHIAFVISTSARDLIPSIALTICHHLPIMCNENVHVGESHVMYYIGVCHVASVTLSFTVCLLWIVRNGYKFILAYGLYMYLLAMALLVGVCYESYGVILFVISDIIIGFRISKLHALSYPLYYASLIYFSVFTP